MSPSLITLEGSIGTYQFNPLSAFAAGGTGKVFQGTIISSKSQDVHVGKNVAIKVLFNDLPQSQYDREKLTSKIRLSHPNVLTNYDFIVKDGISHTITEWVEGETLDKILDQKKSAGIWYTQKEITSTIVNILEGLNALHNNNPPIYHRDIKPSNIMVTRAGKIKIIDFGIARVDLGAFVEDHTSIGTIMGSIKYSPPEQIKGKHSEVNATSDLYAAGILFYFLLTKELPFKGSEFEIMDKQVNQNISIHPNIEESVFKVISKATQKNQEQRYPSANLFIKEIKKAYTKIESDQRLNLKKKPIKKEVVKTKTSNPKTKLIPISLAFLIFAGFIFLYINKPENKEITTITNSGVTDSHITSSAINDKSVEKMDTERGIIENNNKDAIQDVSNPVEKLTEDIAQESPIVAKASKVTETITPSKLDSYLNDITSFKRKLNKDALSKRNVTYTNRILRRYDSAIRELDNSDQTYADKLRKEKKSFLNSRLRIYLDTAKQMVDFDPCDALQAYKYHNEIKISRTVETNIKNLELQCGR